jgi:hypothetical protein
VLCPMNPGRPRCALPQYRASEGAEPTRRDPHRTLRLDLRPDRPPRSSSLWPRRQLGMR